MKSPGFRAAVRTVLNHLSLPMTYANFAAHDKAHGSTFPLAWYEFARNIGNSSSPVLTTVAGGVPESGVFIETKAGKLIDMGKSIASINELIEYKRRVSK
jgi:hypothetical protein